MFSANTKARSSEEREHNKKEEEREEERTPDNQNGTVTSSAFWEGEGGLVVTSILILNIVITCAIGFGCIIC